MEEKTNDLNLTIAEPPTNYIINAINDSNTMTFHANKFSVSNDELCLKFNEAVLDFDKIKTLIFEQGDEKYEYERKNK